MKDRNIDELLRLSLAQTEGPSFELNQSIKNKIEEHTNMQINLRKLIPIPLLVIILTLLMSFSVFAAWKILSPNEVAQKLDDNSLTIAFQSKDGIEINETITSEGYNISFLGVVSGEGISDFKGSAHEIYPDRTYAIVAISMDDGSPMPATSDYEYGKVSFFVSPLIKGEKPWLYNIVTMNGSYSELVINGVMYRLIECDDVEIFADRGLYLCVSSTSFFSREAYNYNEDTGEVSPNPQFGGVNVLFDLPLDSSKANPKEAEKYLQDLYSDESTVSNTDARDELLSPEYIDSLMESAILIPESVKEVSYTNTGSMVYDYDGSKTVCDVRWIFPEDFVGMSEATIISEGEKEIRIRRFNRDENGVITGMVYKVLVDD
ncbi:MAG TPA: hypothetical protein GXZ21_03705 [Clostridiales bacterium]|nr:hypothetical protein [Clostridiales bacterium]